MIRLSTQLSALHQRPNRTPLKSTTWPHPTTNETAMHVGDHSRQERRSAHQALVGTPELRVPLPPP